MTREEASDREDELTQLEYDLEALTEAAARVENLARHLRLEFNVFGEIDDAINTLHLKIEDERGRCVDIINADDDDDDDDERDGETEIPVT
jgi:hypothetical protein